MSDLTPEEIDRANELEDIKAVISTPHGFRFIRRLLTDGKIFHTSMTGNSYTYFNEGRRNLVLRYFEDIAEVAPNQIVQLMKPEGNKK